MAAHLDARQQRGMALAADKAALIHRDARNHLWLVPSQTAEGETYRVKEPSTKRNTHWRCTCPDFTNRGLACKHIWAVRFVRTIQGQEDPALLVQTRLPASAKPAPKVPASPVEGAAAPCKWCGGIETQRYGRCGRKQAYWCKPCGRKFVVEDGFKRLKGDPKVVTLALDLYFKGVSLRQITDTLEQFFNLSVSHVTVYNWLNRYVALLNEYAATLQPDVGTAKWHADEMKVKYGADWRWLWHVMDRETRYLLVSKVTDSRDLGDAEDVFRSAAKLARETPAVIVTDGLPAYIEASKKAFNAGRKRDARHLREIHLSKPERMPNNNMVERLNGTVRGRQRPARGLKSPKGPLTKGQAAYYNLVRPHEALGGKSPAEAAGLSVPTEGNRWLGLVEQARKAKKAKKPEHGGGEATNQTGTEA
jgi:transposase-like protein